MPHVIFIDPQGRRRECSVPAGCSILEIAQDNGIAMEGTCEGSMACATCHVILAPEWFDRLPQMGEDEMDMLDLAFGQTPTSRLGCQVIVEEAHDGLVVRLPAAVRNMLG